MTQKELSDELNAISHSLLSVLNYHERKRLENRRTKLLADLRKLSTQPIQQPKLF